MSAHRIKSYSAESGYVYQYCFRSSRRVRRGLLARGTEYLFQVSGDRRRDLALTVFVGDDSLRAWKKGHGRALSSAEQYAAAKMRLFRAFDASENPEDLDREVVVDAANIGGLLAGLGIGIE